MIGNIKKTVKEGCRLELISKPTIKDIRDFIRLYYESMDRNKAQKKYYFSTEFINDHFNMLNPILVEIKYKNEIIGASMFIYGNKIIHYHLSGSVLDFKGLYPSELILWETIKWAKEKGLEYLHLGGGRGKNDSLFEFKKGFSKTTFPFYIGKNVSNNEEYKKALNLNPILNKPNNHFPTYRYGIDEEVM